MNLTLQRAPPLQVVLLEKDVKVALIGHDPDNLVLIPIDVVEDLITTSRSVCIF
jgi:hypothetical protein